MKRVFLIVLDSFGVGEMPDAADFGDVGSSTIGSVVKTGILHVPNMTRMGLFQIDGVRDTVAAKGAVKETTIGAYGRLAERSRGKDTTTGHWEIAGIISEQAMPTFPEGFPKELIEQLEKETGRKVICNKPYSGTDVIRDYGKEQLETGALIVYTSADSVLQIAAHDALIPTEELYSYCEIARKLCTGPWAVGRVIARPFTGEWPYTRTKLRHDYSLVPPRPNMLTTISEAGKDMRSVGKIVDIFAGSGITHATRTKDNGEGISAIFEELKTDFNGLSFINLVDFDMLYGHRNDAKGYAEALNYFDQKLGSMLLELREEDLLIITADHGCDPGTPSTDHSREYIPVLMFGNGVPENHNFGTVLGFNHIQDWILAYLGIETRA